MQDMKWMKIGRHFRYEDAENKGVKIICGKNESENKSISSWAGEKDAILEVKDVMGPSVIVFAPYTKFALEFAAQIAIRYSDSDITKNSIKIIINGTVEREFITERGENFDIDPYRL
jgi:predicted ribosome quality control (RQC) complex YloA/Tae2 family protein